MDSKTEKALEGLSTNYEMYEKTKKETYERMKESLNEDGSRKYSDKDINERISLLESMQEDIIEKYIAVGGDPKDLVSSYEEPQKSPVNPLYREIGKDTAKDKKVSEIKDLGPLPLDLDSPEYKMLDISDTEGDETFDVIPIPSKGECYGGAFRSIPVSYLTANDENLIISPNLYKDGLIIDYLLRRKIKNKSINPDDLLDGDREAIILWLRATGYGQDYPITVTDNNSGINFDTTVDLSKIEFKPFNLKSDENGWFDFETPISKDAIKFRFLTHKDNNYIKQLELSENNELRKNKINGLVSDLSSLIDSDESLGKDEKLKLFESKRTIEKWGESMELVNDEPFTHNLTNKLELSIMSVNGETDRKFIAKYVRSMKALDSMKLRKYIMDNEPGLDYNVEVKRPESLGGGSMNVFLSLDEFIFLNLA